LNTSVSPFRSVNYRRIEFTSEILWELRGGNFWKAPGT
jgi:hypothetical protein